MANNSVALRIDPTGNVSIGASAAQKLQVSGNAIINNALLGDVGHGPTWAGFSHNSQVGTESYAFLQSNDGLYTLINKKSGGGHIGFRVNNNDVATISDNGSLTVNGSLTARGDIFFPNTGGGTARLSAARYDNESSFQNNNVKLTMANTGLIIGAGPVYEFAIGHSFSSFTFIGGVFRVTTSFQKMFSISQTGQGYFAAGKGGYVFDYFVNRVGDDLEQGDVVVLSQRESSIYSGTNDNIPIPEVDLTTKAYDTRVCGIVDGDVTEQELPFVETPPPSHIPPELKALREGAVAEGAESAPCEHPLKKFAARASAPKDRGSVHDERMGKMVTLGAYSHCKVDADIAPIKVGDLLTTSPTKGHAQKALDPGKAAGSIIGKALASLPKGKGKIPVIVLLQ
jgi:hypothetical protein